MITIFNRRELITLFSEPKLYAIQSALGAAGIGYHTKFATPMGRIGGRARSNPFQNAGAAHDYKIYVHRDDYDRALAAIQPVLRSY